MSTLKALAQVITNGIEQIESACAAQGDAYPTLDDPYTTSNCNVQNMYATEAAPVIAAAYQLIATLSVPEPYLFGWGLASFFSASLAAAGAGCVPDLLREANPNGMHVNEIAAANDMDPGKLGRILRLLASRHVFVEAAPDVFRNNRISSALCTRKSLAAMQARPLEKWDNTNGCSSMSEFLGTDAAKMAGFLVDNLTDPATARSDAPNKAPTQRVFGTDRPFHFWLQLPENALRLARLQHGMRALTGYAAGDLPRGGFEWARLPPGSVVVDVGGGIGTVTMDLATQHNHLRYVIEDLPAVVAQGHTYWSSTMPDLLSSGQVQLQAHDFLEPQPPAGAHAAVYMVRYILHNWPDAYCVTILSHLRAAARPDTTLIVLDQILDHLSRDRDTDDTDTSSKGDAKEEQRGQETMSIPGAARLAAPAPLLPYPDAIAGYAYGLDILMMGALNSQGRTLEQFDAVFRAAGWKLERVCRFSAPHPHQLVCVPV